MIRPRQVHTSAVRCWAWQFGLSWPDPLRIPFEQRFIGIEVASEGGLTEANGALYAFDRISPETRRPRENAFDCGTTWRGYRWFDRYDEPQLLALGRLVDDLCSRFHIPRQYPNKPYSYYGRELLHFQGIIALP